MPTRTGAARTFGRRSTHRRWPSHPPATRPPRRASLPPRLRPITTTSQGAGPFTHASVASPNLTGAHASAASGPSLSAAAPSAYGRSTDYGRPAGSIRGHCPLAKQGSGPYPTPGRQPESIEPCRSSDGALCVGTRSMPPRRSSMLPRTSAGSTSSSRRRCRRRAAARAPGVRYERRRGPARLAPD